MEETAAFVWTHRGAVFVLIAAGFALVAIVQWFAWIFQWGRFDRAAAPPGTSPQPTTLRYVAANFFVEIINDFRHLLALLVVTVACTVKNPHVQITSLHRGFDTVRLTRRSGGVKVSCRW